MLLFELGFYVSMIDRFCWLSWLDVIVSVFYF